MPLDSGHIPCKAEGTACHIATVPAGAGGLVLGVGAGASARWWCCGGAVVVLVLVLLQQSERHALQ
jgi:hypothetical protein